MLAQAGPFGRSWLPALVALVALPGPSFQQHDPVKDFCRRFGHQTALVDRKLYVDGGIVNWKPMSSDPGNYTNTWLAYHDLDDVHEGMPNIHVGLSKNASIPSVHGGALWADDVNYRLFLFGGEFMNTAPTPFNLLSYDIWYDQWDNFGPPGAGIRRVSYGAGVSVSERGEGYYYGGYLSNTSVPGWNGPALATTGMVRYEMDDNSWTNITGPDNIGRAEGVMTFIPVSDNGMLVYFGGVQDPYHNGTVVPQPMDQIFIYDVVSTKWHVQNATGTIPEFRRKFCAGAVWAKDRSSYNIYLNAGLGFDGPGYDDVYILSIPTFTWIKTYPLDRNGTGDYPSHSLTCNIVNESQMLAIGGSFPLDPTGCDYEQNWAVHNVDLGSVIEDRFQDVWAGYQKDLKGYQVPYFVTDVIGGDKDGGATKTTPENGFVNHDLGILLGMTPQFHPRTRADDGRTPPATATPEGNDKESSLSKGAIVGIAVGGGIALIMLIAGIWLFCIKKNKKAKPHPPQELSTSPQSPYHPGSPYYDPNTMSPGYMHPGYPQQQRYSPGSGYSPVPTSNASPSTMQMQQRTPSEMPDNTFRPVELEGGNNLASPVIMADGQGGYVDEHGRPVAQSPLYQEYGTAK